MVPAATITQLPISNIAAGTTAPAPQNDWTTGKEKQPRLKPAPLSIRKARSVTLRLRVARKMNTIGIKANRNANTEISSSEMSCGLVANEYTMAPGSTMLNSAVCSTR